LCVDDNRDLADSYCVLLDLRGYEAEACYDGPTAVRTAHTFRPDVCLVDLTMPGMDGDAVARAILAQATEPPPVLIAVTAMSGLADRIRTHAAGFQAHLIKPVDPRELIRVIESLLARRDERVAIR
jgi:CheY-like chemotaxis protein